MYPNNDNDDNDNNNNNHHQHGNNRMKSESNKGGNQFRRFNESTFSLLLMERQAQQRLRCSAEEKTMPGVWGRNNDDFNSNYPLFQSLLNSTRLSVARDALMLSTTRAGAAAALPPAGAAALHLGGGGGGLSFTATAAAAAAAAAQRYSAAGIAGTGQSSVWGAAAGSMGNHAGLLPLHRLSQLLQQPLLLPQSSTSTPSLLFEDVLLAASRATATTTTTPRTSSALDVLNTVTAEQVYRRANSMDQLQKALDDIPMTEKIDFLAALQIAPDLALSESDPFRFLQNTNWDAPAAANKLVRYWKRRRAIFGDRAFRPMIMTTGENGNGGALTEPDIANIRSGFMAYTSTDQEGCTVAVFDVSRRNSEDPAVRMRSSFYHAQCMSENPLSQTQGVVVLCIINLQRYDHTTMEAISMLVNTFPIKVKAWHTFDCLSQSNTLQKGFLFGFMEAYLHTLNKYTTYFYSSESMEDILWELVTEHGLSLEGIPRILGGTWTYDRFEAWVQERLDLERGRYFYLPTGEPLAMLDHHNNSRRPMDLSSPRPIKRSKRDDDDECGGGEEEKSGTMDMEDDTNYHDGKVRARVRPTRSEDLHNESMDELMTQFQTLLYCSSSDTIPASKVGHARNLLRSHSGRPQHPVEEACRGDSSLRVSSHIQPQHMDHHHGDHYEALQNALDAISVHDKADYLTAWYLVPHLVLQESDPSRFLIFNDNDAEKAAQGMVRYWKQRRELFGDRAFLPMIMTGEGAFTAEDIQFFHCGNLVISGTDQQGSSILLFDASRRTTDDPGVRIRTAFYTWQVLAENPVNQTRGFVAIHIINAPNYDKVLTGALQMVLSVFPIRAKAMHTFDNMKKIDLFRRGFVQGLIGVVMSIHTTCTTRFYSAQQQQGEDVVGNLEQQHGVSRAFLPVSIGGTWSYDRFDAWRQERIQWERERYSSSSSTSSSVLRSVPPARRGPIEPPVEPQPPMTAKIDLSTLQRSEPSAIPHTDAEDCKRPVCEPDRIKTSCNEEMLAPETNDKLRLLENEIRRLPATQTAAYREAIQKAPPPLWIEECNPDWFLQVEEQDARRAAKRMVRYWRWRSQLFGSKQYAPMTQTGDDALGRKELTVFVTGFLSMLPKDTEGRSVLYMDPSLLKDDVAEELRDRCIFYMMSILTENDKSQTDGAILLHRLDGPKYSLVNAPLLKVLIRALPLKFHAIHLISQGDIPKDVIKATESFGTTVHVHKVESKEVVCSQLVESHGLTKAGLPKFVNGDWGYEKFIQWQEFRTRIEWRIPTGLSGRECADMSSFPHMKSYTLLTDDEGMERKRRMNLIHFRRKQNRDRVAIAILKENCIDLREEQKKLLQENQELESKCAAASSMVKDLKASVY